MNILEHVIAGHYPKDSQGRSLVPMVGGGHQITITATDGPGEYPLVGFGVGQADMWTSTGQPFHASYPGDHLAPPLPHKSISRAWVVYPVADDGLPCWGQPRRVYHSPYEAPARWRRPGWTIKEMIHEYEVPWE